MTTEHQHLAHNIPSALAGQQNLIQLFCRRGGRVLVFYRFGQRHDNGQDVIKIMGDATGQCAYRLQFLHLLHVLCQFPGPLLCLPAQGQRQLQTIDQYPAGQGEKAGAESKIDYHHGPGLQRRHCFRSSDDNVRRVSQTHNKQANARQRQHNDACPQTYQHGGEHGHT